MAVNKKVKAVLALLDQYYPIDVKCYLDYDEDKPWQILIATILSAQCTDARVNTVTETLFQKYPTLSAFAAADLAQLEQDIYTTGFYHMKAKHIILTSRILVEQYGGELPNRLDELLKLPGVGRKTANLVLGHVFGIPSIVVDTHVKRVSNRLGLAHTPDPDKVEFELMKLLPKEHWIRYNTQIIAHGRLICKSQRPKCAECVLSPYCDDLAGKGMKKR